MIWLAPDREVYTVTFMEEPWDEGRETLTVVFQCGRTGWTGATEVDASQDNLAVGVDDLALLLKRARDSG
jgi:hypothetical protein